MTLSPRTQAVLLLTTRLVRPSPSDPKPLSAREWAKFASWMQNHKRSPELLLESDDLASVLSGFEDEKITVDRIRYLVAQGGALAIAAEKWERAGIWTIIRGDADYPKRLRERLGQMSPPILFGSGNRQHLNRGGVAIVGSRDATEEDLGFASALGARAASEGVPVVSGGARGVDETAMFGAIEARGVAIGVLADSLLKATISKKYRDSLTNGQTALISSFNPKAGFDVGNAMGRNRYVYCLADTAVVIAVTEGKGGTWAGATENLQRGLVPVWVRTSAAGNAGSDALARLGARSFVEMDQLPSITVLLSDSTPKRLDNDSVGADQHPQSAFGVRDRDPGIEYAPRSFALSKVDQQTLLEVTTSSSWSSFESVRKTLPQLRRRFNPAWPSRKHVCAVGSCRLPRSSACEASETHTVSMARRCAGASALSQRWVGSSSGLW